jgi:hypothetical protein
VGDIISFIGQGTLPVFFIIVVLVLIVAYLGSRSRCSTRSASSS